MGVGIAIVNSLFLMMLFLQFSLFLVYATIIKIVVSIVAVRRLSGQRNSSSYSANDSMRSENSLTVVLLSFLISQEELGYYSLIQRIMATLLLVEAAQTLSLIL